MNGELIAAIGLGLGLIVNIVAIVWFAATVATKLDIMVKTVNNLSSDVAKLASNEARWAVLEYRIGELERVVLSREAA